MTPAIKVVFFFLSLVSMAGFASAGLLMAANRWGLGGILLLVSVFIIGFGFMARARVLRRTNADASRR